MKKTIRKKNEKQIKSRKGITLIALVITIIVLIILAGISISLLTDENGIINNAKDSAVLAEIATFKDKVTMAQAALEAEILKNKAEEDGYIATTNDNFEKIVEDVARSFDISAGDILNVSKSKYQVASTDPVISKLQVATAISSSSIQTEGYTIASSLDIEGNNNTEGHGYITIWYTSNNLRAGIKRKKALNQYKIADASDDIDSEDDAMLIAIMHVKNNTSEFVSFALDDENTTNFGVTTKENAITNAGKKLKETNYALSTKEYTVLTLNANNGTNQKQQENVKVGNAYKLPQNSYNRQGYNFKNWNTSANGTGTNYNPGDAITVGNNNIELYAKWEPIEYTISYELNGGVVESSNPSKYTIESDNFTLNIPSKDGYYFTGWTGSNGSTPQKDLVIAKGSIGNKTYSANYAQYTEASLRTFNTSDSNVSWSFNPATGIYTITQIARSSGWGVGVVCDDSTTDIAWQQNYMLEFEIKVPSSYTLKTDGNTMYSSDGQGNDIYGTSWLIVDGVRTDGNGFGKLPQSTEITGGTWHKVQMYLTNNNTTENTSHRAIRSYSGFGLDLSSVSSNVTYEMRNLKSIVY